MGSDADGSAVLLVDEIEEGRTVLKRLLETFGYTVAVATSFHEGKAFLSAHPVPILIAAVRLGAFNGLQLALQHRFAQPGGLRIVVDDAPDPTTEADAIQFGATYFVRGTSDPDLLSLIVDHLRTQGPGATSAVERRRSGRMPAPFGTTVILGGVSGTLIDVCRGGFRFRIPGSYPDLPSTFGIEVGAHRARIRATVVWQRRDTASALLTCGASVDERDHPSAARWHQFIDELGAPA